MRLIPNVMKKNSFGKGLEHAVCIDWSGKASVRSYPVNRKNGGQDAR
jgi:hypothetical protein